MSFSESTDGVSWLVGDFVWGGGEGFVSGSGVGVVNLSIGAATTALPGCSGGGSVCVFVFIGLLVFTTTAGGISSSVMEPPFDAFLIKVWISLNT